MRKADYNLLANAIDTIIKSSHRQCAQLPDKKEYYDGRIEAVTSLAEFFAQCACVNKDEFLKQCGVKKK